MFNEIFFEIMLEYALNILSGIMYYKNNAKQINNELFSKQKESKESIFHGYKINYSRIDSFL